MESHALSGYRKEYGDHVARAVVVLAICDLIDFFNVGQPMNDRQIAQTADLVLDKFWMLKLEDLRVCFDRAKSGKYGQVYNRIDGQVIMTWMDTYLEERLEIAEANSEHLHHRHQSPQREQPTDAEFSKVYSDYITSKHPKNE